MSHLFSLLLNSLLSLTKITFQFSPSLHLGHVLSEITIVVSAALKTKRTCVYVYEVDISGGVCGSA